MFFIGFVTAITIYTIVLIIHNKRNKKGEEEISLPRISGEQANTLSYMNRDLEKEPIIDYIYNAISKATERGLVCISVDTILHYKYTYTEISDFTHKYTAKEVQEFFRKDNYLLSVLNIGEHIWYMKKISWSNRDLDTLKFWNDNDKAWCLY